MFSKKSQEAVSFPSNWKTEQSLAASGCQTEETSFEEAGCQVLESTEVAIQTEDEYIPAQKAPEYNEETLIAFLKRITPKVIQEIERHSRSRAFDGLSLHEKDDSSGVKLLHTIRWNQLNSDDVVNCLDWNCTGSVLAISYGPKYHDNWCDHNGQITVWNINRSDFDTNQPERGIEVTSCVLSLAFHPQNPAVLSAGTFNGEVLVFNLSHSEDVTPIASGECSGSVTALSWLKKLPGDLPYTKAPNAIVTATSNGYIFIWGLSLTKQTLQLKSG
ncbi:WD repeat-containing protein 34, partial [Halocaridina rubra]